MILMTFHVTICQVLENLDLGGLLCSELTPYSKNVILLQNLWTYQYMDAFMDDALVFKLETSNWLLEPLEVLLHSNSTEIIPWL